MQLLKIQCTSCGSPMEVSPGINRVRCPSCGMTYLIDKGNSRKDPGFVEDASGDNPVEVLLVPLSNNTLPMHTYDYKGAANTGSTDNPCLYPEAGNWVIVDGVLKVYTDSSKTRINDQVIRILSADRIEIFSYADGKTYILNREVR